MFHEKSTSPDNIGPGSYEYLPMITLEGPKFTMNSSNYNLKVAPNDFVPGPKYVISDKVYKIPRNFR